MKWHGAVWVTLVGSVAGGGCSDDATGVSANPVLWESHGVRLEADDFYIETTGRLERYRADVPGVAVGGSASGNSKTLEIEWNEHGSEMRLYIYLRADTTEWESHEIRTYDGAPDGNWVYYYGPFFQSAVGSTFTGDVDLTSDSSDRGVTGRLHFTNLRLTAF